MKIVSQNFCLGLPNKIDLARKWITTMDMDIFAIQEAEITKDVDLDFLKITNYELQTTISPTNLKSRLAIYVKSSIKTEVKVDPKTEIILITVKDLDVFCCYRPFKITGSSAEYVKNMTDFIIKNTNQSNQTVIIGDLNYDLLKNGDSSYPLHKTFEPWTNMVDFLGLTQLVDKPTWSRSIQGSIKKSLLDHCYVSTEDLTCTLVDLQIGDHIGLCLTSKDHKASSNRKKYTGGFGQNTHHQNSDAAFYSWIFKRWKKKR